MVNARYTTLVSHFGYVSAYTKLFFCLGDSSVRSTCDNRICLKWEG